MDILIGPTKSTDHPSWFLGGYFRVLFAAPRMESGRRSPPGLDDLKGYCGRLPAAFFGS